jgi:hypothetical protein
MSKKEMISIRITSQQKKTLKKLRISYSTIWNAGYHSIVPKTMENLKNLAKKHYDLYIHFNQLYIQFDEENKLEKTKIDEICLEYIEQNRSIEKPNDFDKNWIVARIKKKNLDNSVDDFLIRCKKLKRGG